MHAQGIDVILRMYCTCVLSRTLLEGTKLRNMRFFWWTSRGSRIMVQIQIKLVLSLMKLSTCHHTIDRYSTPQASIVLLTTLLANKLCQILSWRIIFMLWFQLCFFVLSINWSRSWRTSYRNNGRDGKRATKNKRSK